MAHDRSGRPRRVGDAFCAAFATATDGLDAALAAQRALRDEEWGETGPIRVRGEHAVERQPYDVALMDVQMAEMDRLEATRQICARRPRGQRPYIIAMAANAMQGHRELYLEAGVDGYLSKPIQIEELVGALERA